MEEKSEKTAAVVPGTRQGNLKKSFKLGVRSLLTACSKEDFCKAFPNFTAAEHDRLHRLYIQVITSLHENIEDEFESLCLETQAGTTLDIVEQLVEEQSLDPLLTERSDICDCDNCMTCGLPDISSELGGHNRCWEHFPSGLAKIVLNLSNIKEVGQYMSEAKKNEIHYLTSLLKKAEEQKHILNARLELLKKDRQDIDATGIIEKLRSGIVNYGVGNSSGLPNV